MVEKTSERGGTVILLRRPLPWSRAMLGVLVAVKVIVAVSNSVGGGGMKYLRMYLNDGIKGLVIPDQTFFVLSLNDRGLETMIF